MLKTVDLPHPLGPMIETNSPWATVRDMRSTATTAESPDGNVFMTSLSTNCACDCSCRGRSSLLSTVFMSWLCRLPGFW
jgi:hypothetical protein